MDVLLDDILLNDEDLDMNLSNDILLSTSDLDSGLRKLSSDAASDGISPIRSPGSKLSPKSAERLKIESLIVDPLAVKYLQEQVRRNELEHIIEREKASVNSYLNCRNQLSPSTEFSTSSNCSSVSNSGEKLSPNTEQQHPVKRKRKSESLLLTKDSLFGDDDFDSLFTGDLDFSITAATLKPVESDGGLSSDQDSSVGKRTGSKRFRTAKNSTIPAASGGVGGVHSTPSNSPSPSTSSSVIATGEKQYNEEENSGRKTTQRSTGIRTRNFDQEISNEERKLLIKEGNTWWWWWLWCSFPQGLQRGLGFNLIRKQTPKLSEFVLTTSPLSFS